MNAFFKELFNYSYHTNCSLIDIFLVNSQNTTEKSIKLFSHILNAHHVWNSRIKNVPPSFTTWQIHEMKDFKVIEKENYENSLSILNDFDLNQQIHYVLSNGKSFNNSVQDLLFQIINHSTYHRAQIATEFKNSGIEPLTSDYIAYKW